MNVRLFYGSLIENLEGEKYMDIPYEHIKEITVSYSGYYRMIVTYNEQNDNYPEFATKIQFI